MIPHHIQTLLDYREWFRAELDQSGGYLLDEQMLLVETGELGETAMGQTEDMLIPRQRLAWWNGPRLEFDLLVRAQSYDQVGGEAAGGEPVVDFEHVRYRYHLTDNGGRLIWRLDKHKDHGHGETHLHLPGRSRWLRGERILPTTDYDIGMVFDRIRQEGLLA